MSLFHVFAYVTSQAMLTIGTYPSIISTIYLVLFFDYVLRKVSGTSTDRYLEIFSRFLDLLPSIFGVGFLALEAYILYVFQNSKANLYFFILVRSLLYGMVELTVGMQLIRKRSQIF